MEILSDARKPAGSKRVQAITFIQLHKKLTTFVRPPRYQSVPNLSTPDILVSDCSAVANAVCHARDARAHKRDALDVTVCGSDGKRYGNKCLLEVVSSSNINLF